MKIFSDIRVLKTFTFLKSNWKVLFNQYKGINQERKYGMDPYTET